MQASREIAGLQRSDIRHVGRTVVSDLERGLRLPGSDIVMEIARAVGADLERTAFLMRRARDDENLAKLRRQSAALAPYPPSELARPTGRKVPYIEVISADGAFARALPEPDDPRNVYLIPHIIERAVDRYRIGADRRTMAGTSTRKIRATDTSLDRLYWTVGMQAEVELEYLRVQLCGDVTAVEVIQARRNSYVFLLQLHKPIDPGESGSFTADYAYGLTGEEDPGRWVRFRVPAEEVEVSVDFPIGDQPARAWTINQPTEQAIGPEPGANELLVPKVSGSYVTQPDNVRPGRTVGIHWRR
ncbi:hypothetical protein [Dactylosporangium sp. NPDC051541]|uniref:hypothetical protein n=1 Tax=Dactylosporangium sp. NPDC051541 TaxID=3363977 RepID=UPI0037B9CE9D